MADLLSINSHCIRKSAIEQILSSGPFLFVIIFVTQFYDFIQIGFYG